MSIKSTIAAAGIVVVLATSSFAGGLAEAITEPDIIMLPDNETVDALSGGSLRGNGILVPALLALAVFGTLGAGGES